MPVLGKHLQEAPKIRTRYSYLLLTLLLTVFAIAPLAYPGYMQVHSGFIPAYNLADLGSRALDLGWTPHVTTILTGIAVGVTSMFTTIDEMVDLTNIGTLFAFILVCIGVLILRKREPNRYRAFRTPFVPVVPILGALSCLYLMQGLPTITWLRFGGWLILGMILYFLYGYHHSKLRSRK